MSNLIDDLSQLVSQVKTLQNKVTNLEDQVDQLKKEQKDSKVPEVVSQKELADMKVYGNRNTLLKYRHEMDDSGINTSKFYYKRGRLVYFYFRPFKKWFKERNELHKEELKHDMREGM